MEVFVAAIVGMYVALLLIFIYGWEKAVRPVEAGKGIAGIISVIIPARNEEKNLSPLLTALLAQRFDNYEIIVVDDHSTDNTIAVAMQFGSPKIRVVTNDGHGKKSAIATGVKVSQGGIIACTDADCYMDNQWLNAINRNFSDPDTQLTFGAVSISQDHSFFSAWQSLEFSSLTAVSGATAAFGFPTMCNGANLAFRKNAFQFVNGYEQNVHIASGDDEFLMRSIREKFPNGIKFDGSKARVVITEPLPTAHDFFQQRIRWASKWKANTSLITVALALFVVLTQLSTVFLWVMFLSGHGMAGVLLIIKATGEYLLLWRTMRFLNVSIRLIPFLVLQLTYPFYALAVGIASNFISFRWKGRLNGLDVSSARN